MADTKISAMTSAGALTGTEEVPVVQSGANVKTTVQDIANLASGGGGIAHTVASGTDTYTATVTGVTSYADGDAYLVKFTNGNTTGCSLNINSLGDRTLFRNNDGALIGGDIWANGEMLCVYDSALDGGAGGFQCIGTSPNSIFAYVTNDDSVSITKGQVVYAWSGTGDRMTVKRANNTTDATSARTVGMVYSSSIAAGQKGIIILQGLITGLANVKPIDGWQDGDIVYLDNTNGGITKIKPYAPNHLVYVGIVTSKSSGSAGIVYVKVQNGYELDELHDVQAQSPSNNDTLYYDLAATQWKTASISTILGYTPISASSTDTLTNKRITARTGTIASTGTPSINIDNVDYYSITALATAITSVSYTGTPTTGQTLWISIKDDGVLARGIAWGSANWEASGNVALPTTTVLGVRLDVAFIWNEATSKWRCVGVA